MAIVLAQSPAGTASSANSPASLPVTLSTGNNRLLFLFVTVTGTPPSCNTPGGGWAILASNVTANLASYVFWFPNAPSISTVTLTCSATNGGITASFFSFNLTTLPTMVPIVEFTNTQSGTGTTIQQLTNQRPANTNELSICYIGSQAATFTPTMSGEWAGNVNGVASTGGTTNAQGNTFWAVNPNDSIPQLQGSLSASVAWNAFLVRLTSPDSGGLTYDVVSGNAGMLAGQFFQGMIGG